MRRLKAIAWIVFYLAFIDVLINVLFQYPKNPRNIHPTFLQSYFDYGRSVEGKLRWMTRPEVGDSAPRVSGGWLEDQKAVTPLPVKASEQGEVLIACYGMSHTEELWKAISKTDKRFVIRGFMAAGATPNWSYAAYEADRRRHKADVVILGILTDTVPLITTTTGMTAHFDMGYPYTYPRYRVMNGGLSMSSPPFRSAQGFISCLYDPSKWRQYRTWLAANDKYYDPLLFQGSPLDYSALVRLLRRAYAQSKKQESFERVYGKGGFVDQTEEIRILRAMIRTFAESAREDGIIPVVYLVNSQGRSDHLFRILKPVLDTYKIPYLSTHNICPPDDPRVFLSENSHFIPAKDMQLAMEMIKIIRAELLRRQVSTTKAAKSVLATSRSH